VSDDECFCDPAEFPDIGCPDHGPRCEVHGPHPGTVDCVDCIYGED
jgi:hypothetical protein